MRNPPPLFVFSQLAKSWGEIVPLDLALVNAVAAADGPHPFGGSLPFDAGRYSWIERVLCDVDTDIERPPPAVAAIGAVPSDSDDGDHGGYSRGGGGGSGVGFGRLIKLTFDTLLGDTTKECFVRIGVLAEGTVAPFEMLSNLWDQVKRIMIVVKLTRACSYATRDPPCTCYVVSERLSLGAAVYTRLFRARHASHRRFSPSTPPVS